MYLLKVEENIPNRVSSSRYNKHFIYLWWCFCRFGQDYFSKRQGSSIGFEAEVKSLEDKKTGEWMKNLEPEDLLRYGLIPEFIGRLPITATLEDLDEKSLVKILLEPKNSLVKQYQELFKLEGVKIKF